MPDDFNPEFLDDDDNPEIEDLGRDIGNLKDEISDYFAELGIELNDIVITFGSLDDIDGLRGNAFGSAEEAFAYLTDAGLWDFSEIVYDDLDDVYYVYVGDSNGDTA